MILLQRAVLLDFWAEWFAARGEELVLIGGEDCTPPAEALEMAREVGRLYRRGRIPVGA